MCCFHSNQMCCFHSYQMCCFHSNQMCCFHSYQMCCFHSYQLCCFHSNQMCCFHSNQMCCFHSNQMCCFNIPSLLKFNMFKLNFVYSVQRCYLRQKMQTIFLTLISDLFPSSCRFSFGTLRMHRYMKSMKVWSDIPVDTESYIKGSHMYNLQTRNR